MKQLILFSISILILTGVPAQTNLIRNGSFEETVRPFRTRNMDGNKFKKYLPYWFESFPNPDLFSPSSNHTQAGTPKNCCGKQEARTGENYVGSVTGVVNYDRMLCGSEGFVSELSSPLKRGKKYSLTFFISIAEGSEYIAPVIEILFTDKKIRGKSALKSLSKKTPSSQITSQKLLSNSDGWSKIQICYESLGGEIYMYVGNFNCCGIELNHLYKNPVFKAGRYPESSSSFYYFDDFSMYELPEDFNSTIEEANEATNLAVQELAIPLKLDSNKITLDQIEFNIGSADLTPESKDILDSLAFIFLQNYFLNFDITGFTDNVGSAYTNKTLSEKRAESVVNYFSSKGIAMERFKFYGKGEEEPVDSNETEEGRAKNRRVEILMY